MIDPNLRAAMSVQTPGGKCPVNEGEDGNELYESGVPSDLKEADQNNNKRVPRRGQRTGQYMRCKSCNQDQFLHLSQSRDHWYLRLVLAQAVRCHYCGHSFLAPVWYTVPRPYCGYGGRCGLPHGAHPTNPTVARMRSRTQPVQNLRVKEQTTVTSTESGQ